MHIGRTLTQLLLYYTRFLEIIKKFCPDSAVLSRKRQFISSPLLAPCVSLTHESILALSRSVFSTPANELSYGRILRVQARCRNEFHSSFMESGIFSIRFSLT